MALPRPSQNLTMSTVTIAILGIVAVANAQTTAFTYQGQLKNGGSPAGGNFDMTFRLFDADSGGNQIGKDFLVSSVPVTSGLFTTSVDFGSVFGGAPLWLEVQVGDQVLSPRQPLTSAPYSQTASYAQSCGVASYANAPWVPTGNDLYYNNGNVGIGTSKPTARLEVAGEAGVDGIKFPDGTTQTSAASVGDSLWTANGDDISNANSGSVGIGTATPLGSLEVKKPGHTLISGGALGVTADTTPFPASAGSGVFLTGGGPNANVFGFNYTTFQPVPLTLQTPGGNVGIGTSTPGDRLTVKTASNNYGITHTDGTISLSTFVGGSGVGGYIGTQSSHPLFFYTNGGGPLMTVTTGGNVGIGTTTPGGKLEVVGRTITHSLQIIGGSDLAEPFDVIGPDVQPGMVVVIDSAHPGRLKPCGSRYDRKVAGIVSGAGGVSTALSMGQEGTLASGKQPVALSGRVYCLADASSGAIEPGDMLTTSAVIGHAMKASDFDRARGAIIGKAMTSLASGKGLVLVL
ncbi:MAG TPA: hypothetical protein VMV81_04720, partial [Phycisphaerae bacterium]|nr:hypothetical protein [Phycisphaerae bacterium]